MTCSTVWCVLLSGVLGLSGMACDAKNEGPPLSPSPNPAGPPAPVLAGLTLTGNVSLSAVGETSQLTATASYSDGTTKDVSSQTSWTISDRRVLTSSTTGLLTVVGFGRTFVSARFENKNTFAAVTATPPGTFVITGRVREPGQGGVLDAMITDRGTGLSAMSNAEGVFQLAALPAPQARLGITKAEYEPRELDATSSPDVDAPIQRIVRLTAGESIEPPPLAPNDLAYQVDGVDCRPCRMIRIVVPTTGDMELVLTWEGPSSLILFAGGMRVVGESGRASGFLTIPTPRELVVYVGASRLIDHTKFKLATTLP
jgi:hypothetical protein